MYNVFWKSMGTEQKEGQGINKGILNKYLEADPRIGQVITLSREVYDRANLPNHNFNTHIAQVTYRALVIAESDGLDFNPSILIAASLLHDIGYSVNRKQEGHEEAGSEVSRQILKDSGFDDRESDAVIKAVVEYATPGVSVEADILFDADILNQAGFASMYSFFVSLYEYKQFPNGDDEGYRLDSFLKSRLFIAEQLKEMGLRTKKGREMLQNGFDERKEFIEDALKGVGERPDMLVTFDDLITP